MVERLRRLDLTSSKDGFVDEDLVFVVIVPASASSLHFGKQVVAFEKVVDPFLMAVFTLARDG